jgi:hypothetical protein
VEQVIDEMQLSGEMTLLGDEDSSSSDDDEEEDQVPVPPPVRSVDVTHRVGRCWMTAGRKR